MLPAVPAAELLASVPDTAPCSCHPERVHYSGVYTERERAAYILASYFIAVY